MFKNPSLLFDILCTVVWIGLSIHYARKGFLAAVLQFCGTLLCLLGAHRLSSWAADALFQNVLAGHFHSQIVGTLSTEGIVDLSGIANRYAGFLPESFRSSIVASCERSITVALSSNADALADLIIQKVLYPLLTPVITVMIFFVAFALLRMLVSMLGTVLGLVNKLPVVGTVNRWLGWGMGGAASLLDIYLVLCVLWAVIAITGGNLAVLNDSVMSSSIYYKIFNLFNPFL